MSETNEQAVQAPTGKDFKQNNVLPDEIRMKLQGVVDQNWDKIIQSLVDLATGIWVERTVTDKNGQPKSVRVYQQEPDSATAQYLTNQVIGKPKEAMNIEGKVNLILDV